MNLKSEILTLIKSVITKHNIDLEINLSDLEISGEKLNILTLTNEKFRNSDNNKSNSKFNDKIHKYIFEQSISRKNDHSLMYHSLKGKYALSTIKEKEIQLSALSYFWDNDPLEFSEFDRRTRFSLNYNKEKEISIKNRIFVFCFSDTVRNEKSWELYGDNETGVSIGFRFKVFSDNENIKNLFNLRDVIYDKGYDFDFIIELKLKLLQKFNLTLTYEGVLHFGKFYKRDKFRWEREIRLCFDYRINDDYIDFMNNTFVPLGININPKKELRKHFNPKYDKLYDRHYISVPFINDFFELEINELICGKNISNELFSELQNIALKNNIQIWKRK